MTRVRDLVLIFSNPAGAARALSEKPDWVIPFVVVLAITFVFAFSTYRHQLELQRHVLEEMRTGGRDLDVDALVRPTLAKRIMVSVMATVGAALAIVIASAILSGLASILGGKSGFRRVFSLYARASLIGALGFLVKIPLVFAKGSIDVRTSAAAFAPGVSLQSPLGAALNSLDVFSLWMLGAVVVAFSVATGLGTKKSAVVVVGLWALFVLVSVGMAAIRSGFAG